MFGEWQPIETAPRDGTELLVSGFEFDEPREGRWVCCAEYVNREWVEKSGLSLYPPTHWMPLPPPPSDGD